MPHTDAVHDHPGNDHPAHDQSVAEFWEARYADEERVWTGRVNAVLAEVAAAMPPGRALDLGCGEGGDVVWLASNGWEVTGVDLSPTAIARARDAADAAGIPRERVTLEAADLADWTTDARFDLVTASFLQSWPAEIPRDEILRRGAGFVAPGGSILITAHAEPPAGSAAAEHGRSHEGHQFPTPSEDLAALALDPAAWEVVVAEVREREGARPDGEAITFVDGIVLARRR
ncbi:bifunctional 2-polyprenyl-6-hydroxyphenol methylase/3-demethylubiquinol 3-O-methyltransferase UbiG [Agromyces sp. LHK192]|uniref:class I SAM-dependent methyltransferase n=1 Tax=Agromyces sp. LHK192 TaxID=2498704 RepID=UPI000FD6F04F|nr:class I SAM-dependent methyltransferase [Agromyces sp. LHK192]